MVTGSRAEYGLLKWLIRGLAASVDIDLQVLVTGMHLSPEFGNTWQELSQDGVEISRRVEMLVSSDSGVGLAKSIALGVAGMADAFGDLKPDTVIVLGDRFEMLAAAVAAVSLQIRIGHIHGGELTEGLIDDQIRHAITKMSHVHFVSTQRYAQRVAQMGEDPTSIHVVGALGIDGISHVGLFSRDQLAEKLGIAALGPYLVATYHPETLAPEPLEGLVSLLEVLDNLEGVQVLFTLPNADPAGRAAAALIRKHACRHPHAYVFDSLGQRLYLSALRSSLGVVGNSSSALIEAPTLGIGAVNIGNRQRGRDRGPTVIDTGSDVESIRAGVHRLLSRDFVESIREAVNPYGTPGASGRIVELLERMSGDHAPKTFHDLVI